MVEPSDSDFLQGIEEEKPSLEQKLAKNQLSAAIPPGPFKAAFEDIFGEVVNLS